MKKTITLIAFMVLGLLYNATSQSSSDSSVIQKSEFIIEHLNKNNIPTGILYDMVVPFAQLFLHNGQNDSAICSPLQFQQAYFEFYQSAFNKQSLTTPESIINLIQDEYPNNLYTLPLP